MGRLHDFLEKRPPRRPPVQLEFGIGIPIGDGCLLPLALLAALCAWGVKR